MDERKDDSYAKLELSLLDVQDMNKTYPQKQLLLLTTFRLECCWSSKVAFNERSNKTNVQYEKSKQL